MKGDAGPAVAEPFGLLIGGEWLRRSADIDVRNPFDGELVAIVTAGTAEDVDAAVTAGEASLATERRCRRSCSPKICWRQGSRPAG